MSKLSDMRSVGQFLAQKLSVTPESVGGGLRILRTPHVAPLAYFHVIYPPLLQLQIDEASLSLGRKVPNAYAQVLLSANGASLFGGVLSLRGYTPKLSRNLSGLGQPVSLIYGNLFERPAGLPEDDFAIGTYVCGDNLFPIFMDNSSAIKVIDLAVPTKILSYWKSFDSFIGEEMNRLADLFDASGQLVANVSKLMPE